MSIPLTTTNPTPPVGGQANEIFTVDSSFQNQTIEANLSENVDQLAALFPDIYLKTVVIDNLMVSKSVLRDLTFSAVNPLMGQFIPSVVDASRTMKYILPWSLTALQFHAMAVLDFDIVLRPIKVHDCRVSLDVFFTFNGNYNPNNIETIDYMKDNATFMLDSTEQEIVIPIPLYKIFDTFPTRGSFIPDTLVEPSLEYQVNAMLPTTIMTVSIRNQYQNSTIQPDKFDLQVWLRPRVSNTQKFCSPTCNEFYVDDATDALRKLYFYSLPWPIKQPPP